MRHFRSSLLAQTALATATAALAAPAALGQDTAYPIEEIIVTAQKREQSVQDVPLTISVLGGDQLDALQITEFDQLSDFVPGLVVQEQSPNNPGFVIRGITSDSGVSNIAPRVTVYENGFDVSRSRGSFFELHDIERIEVVKGPQATLFGTAALIGAVSVITAKPQEELSAEVEAAYGNFDYIKARGHITGGNEIVQGRLAVSYRRRDGFVDNIAGQPDSQTADQEAVADLNGLEIFSIRPSIRFTPSDRFLADLVVSYQQEDPPATAFKSGVLAPTGGSTDPFSFAELAGSPVSESVLGDDLGLDRRRISATLTMSYDLSDVFTFTSTSGFLDFDSREVFDADGSPAVLLEFAEDAEGTVFSQEFRLNYDLGSRFRGFIGANYYHEDGSQSVPFSTDETVFFSCLELDLDPFTPNIASIRGNCQGSGDLINRINLLALQDPALAQGIGAAIATAFDDPFNPAPIPGVPVEATLPFPEGTLVPVAPSPGAELLYAGSSTNTANLDTLSVFLDGAYNLLPNLEITGGIRYIYEDREGGFFGTAPNSFIFETVLGVPTPLPLVTNTDGVEFITSEDFHSVVGRVAVRYDITDQVSAYFTAGRGRASPIVEIDDATLAQNIIDPEIVWNYEGGIKASLGPSLPNFEVAVFFQDYEDFQTTINTPTGFQSVTAGDAGNIGVEVAINQQLTDWLGYFGNFAYTEGEIDDDPANGIFAGTQFRLQPRWTAAAGLFLDYAVTADLRVFADASWSYRSDVFFEQENLPIAGLAIAEDDVNLLNLRAGIGDTDGSWEVAGFVTNLTDTDYIVDAGNTGGIFGTPTFIAGPPRFFGIEAVTRF